MTHHAANANSELGVTGWRKPWSGTGGGNCVEVKQLTGSEVAMRQSTDPNGLALIFGQEAIAAFVRGVRDGEADFLL